jgi:hypothetical protein
MKSLIIKKDNRPLSHIHRIRQFSNQPTDNLQSVPISRIVSEHSNLFPISRCMECQLNIHTIFLLTKKGGHADLTLTWVTTYYPSAILTAAGMVDRIRRFFFWESLRNINPELCSCLSFTVPPSDTCDVLLTGKIFCVANLNFIIAPT